MATAIIPAYNEAPRIGAVLQSVLAAGLDQVIVVDDGSSDETAQVAQEWGAAVLHLPRNGGKGAALLAGAEAAHDPHLVLLDADLTGLRPAHVQALLAPVVSGAAELVVGQVDHQPLPLVPSISGQRAILSRHVTGAPDLADSGWGAEIALTRAVAQAGGRTEIVRLDGVYHATRIQKRGLLAGLIGAVQTDVDLLRAAFSGWTIPALLLLGGAGAGVLLGSLWGEG